MLRFSVFMPTHRPGRDRGCVDSRLGAVVRRRTAIVCLMEVAGAGLDRLPWGRRCDAAERGPGAYTRFRQLGSRFASARQHRARLRLPRRSQARPGIATSACFQGSLRVASAPRDPRIASPLARSPSQPSSNHPTTTHPSPCPQPVPLVNSPPIPRPHDAPGVCTACPAS